MSINTLSMHSACIIICISLFSSCQEDFEAGLPLIDQETRTTLATDCRNDCFEPGNAYPEKEYQTTLWWENRQFSKTVDLVIYNSGDSLFFRLKSSHEAAYVTIVLEGIMQTRFSRNIDLPANTWTFISFLLPEGWQSCDSIEAEVNVNGEGPAAVFNIHYHLVGICNNPSTVTDIDGNEYAVLKFGNQYWMAENLKVTRYRNGDPIPCDLEAMQWNYTTEGATAVNDYWYYEDISNLDDVVAVFGRHYNWFAVQDTRGLCPAGWHIPSDEEWDQLAAFLVNHFDGTTKDNLGLKLKSTTRWGYDFDDDYNGTNEFGFNALPAGYIEFPHKISWDMAYYAGWWSSTAKNEAIAITRYISYSEDKLIKGVSPVQTGETVRCTRIAE
jgi:uncharacterized protein (TIGR02145 family)